MKHLTDVVGAFDKMVSKSTLICESLSVFEDLIVKLYDTYTPAEKELSVTPKQYAGALFIKYLISGASLSDDVVLNPGPNVNTRKRVFIENLRSNVYRHSQKIHAALDSKSSSKREFEPALNFLEILRNDIVQYSPMTLAQRLITSGKTNTFKGGIVTATYEALNSGVPLEKFAEILMDPSGQERNGPKFREYNTLQRKIKSLSNN